MTFEQYGGWQVEDGFEEFVQTARECLDEQADEILLELAEDGLQGFRKHPNGFWVRTLENDAHHQLRLHVWPPSSIPELTPHSHPWHMASRVLAGTYVEHLPGVDIFSQNPTHDLMVPKYNDRYEQVGVQPAQQRVRFDLGELHRYDAGDYHYLPAGAFHATPLPENDPLLTLVYTGPQLYSNPSFVESNVQPSSREKASFHKDRELVSPEEAAALWLEIERVFLG